jgi:hypothetical protein
MRGGFSASPNKITRAVDDLFLIAAVVQIYLAALVVGITVCVAIGYIVFLQPNPDSNVPDLQPSDPVVKTPPDETSSTQHLSETGTVINHSKNGDLSK